MAIALLGVAVLLAGCGQKGSLYFPDQDQKKDQKKAQQRPDVERPRPSG